MDASVKSSFDVNDEMLKRIESMEESVQAASKTAKDAEEKVREHEPRALFEANSPMNGGRIDPFRMHPV